MFLALPLSSIRIIPKSLHKSRHGRRAGSTEEPAWDGSRPMADDCARPSSNGAAWPLHRSASRSLSSRAELHRDKVLKKLCARASEHQAAPTEVTAPPLVAPHASPTIPSDQASLIDCPVIIHPDALWVTATGGDPQASPDPSIVLPQPPVSSAPIQSSATLEAGTIPQAFLLSPDQLQQIISAAVQQS